MPNCSAYLDDLVIYLHNWTAKLHTLCTVFEQAALTLNLAKRDFAQATVSCLGKQVGH